MKAKIPALGTTIVAAIFLLASAGCDHLPGKPGFRPETLRPSQTVDFTFSTKKQLLRLSWRPRIEGPRCQMTLRWPARVGRQEHMFPIVASGESLTVHHGFALSPAAEC